VKYNYLPLWGSGHYTDDSRICLAAKHIGIPDNTAMRLTIRGRQKVFCPTFSKKGFSSQPFLNWHRSYSISTNHTGEWSEIPADHSCDKQFSVAITYADEDSIWMVAVSEEHLPPDDSVVVVSGLPEKRAWIVRHQPHKTRRNIALLVHAFVGPHRFTPEQVDAEGYRVWTKMDLESSSRRDHPSNAEAGAAGGNFGRRDRAGGTKGRGSVGGGHESRTRNNNGRRGDQPLPIEPLPRRGVVVEDVTMEQLRHADSAADPDREVRQAMHEVDHAERMGRDERMEEQKDREVRLREQREQERDGRDIARRRRKKAENERKMARLAQQQQQQQQQQQTSPTSDTPRTEPRREPRREGVAGSEPSEEDEELWQRALEELWQRAIAVGLTTAAAVEGMRKYVTTGRFSVKYYIQMWSKRLKSWKAKEAHRVAMEAAMLEPTVGWIHRRGAAYGPRGWARQVCLSDSEMQCDEVSFESLGDAQDACSLYTDCSGVTHTTWYTSAATRHSADGPLKWQLRDGDKSDHAMEDSYEKVDLANGMGARQQLGSGVGCRQITSGRKADCCAAFTYDHGACSPSLADVFESGFSCEDSNWISQNDQQEDALLIFDCELLVRSARGELSLEEESEEELDFEDGQVRQRGGHDSNTGSNTGSSSNKIVDERGVVRQPGRMLGESGMRGGIDDKELIEQWAGHGNDNSVDKKHGNVKHPVRHRTPARLTSFYTWLLSEGAQISALIDSSGGLRAARNIRNKETIVEIPDSAMMFSSFATVCAPNLL
jgi:hypothetical protein